MMQRAIDRVGIERVGIYSMATMWNRIACNTSLYNTTQLWWAHWSGGESFADYQVFGGWAVPLAKQYADSGPGCYVDVDMDWRGTGSCGWDESSLQLKHDREKQMEVDAAAMALARSSDDSASPSNCTIGVDLATPVSVSAFQCLIATRGVQFLVVRAFQSNCLIDPHTVSTIQAAWSAGIQGVDVYFFPSVGCSMEPVLQFEATMEHLRRNNVANFSTMWFDVETSVEHTRADAERRLAGSGVLVRALSAALNSPALFCVFVSCVHLQLGVVPSRSVRAECGVVPASLHARRRDLGSRSRGHLHTAIDVGCDHMRRFDQLHVGQAVGCAMGPQSVICKFHCVWKLD